MNQQITPLAKAVRQACAPQRRRRLAGALVASASVLGTTAAVAGPEGGQVVGGVGTITQTDTSTLIHQGTDRVAIDWQSFNVAQNESVRFDQPSNSAVALNRIFDQSPSQILGALDANGHVYLINPNGIVFGQNATINVGALIASSLDVSLQDFMAGHPEFNANGSAGLVVNRGLIRAATGGSVALLGGSVANEGVIVADLGQVTLGAGTHASLDFDGDGLLFFAIDGEALANAQGDAAVSNSGQIQADGGKVLLSGKAAQNVFSNVVNNEGVIRAARIENTGGVVRLVGDGAPVLTSGTIDVSGGDAASTGGRIEMLGDKVGVASGASLLADGQAGGGTILVGGDAHGGGGVPTADYTFVGSDATLSADALGTGDGGKVVVWADKIARMYGDISARGGAEGGNGGFIETSGKKWLDFQGSVNAGAPNGLGGKWLLDPENIRIVTVAPAGVISVGVNITESPGADPVFEPTAGQDDPGDPDLLTVIDVDNINVALNSGFDVEITTTVGGDPNEGIEPGNITVESPITKSAAGPSKLTLRADNDITILPGATISENNELVTLNVELIADGSVTVGAPITVPNGSILIQIDADEATPSPGGNGTESLTIRSALTAASIDLDGTATTQDDELVVELGSGATVDWVIDGANTGTVDLDSADGVDPADFDNFVRLTGGDQTDTFTFSGAADLGDRASGAGGDDIFNVNVNLATAALYGGSQTTATGDRLNLAIGTDLTDTVALTAASADGFDGTEDDIAGGFFGIGTLNTGGDTDSLTGLNENGTWDMAAAASNSVYTRTASPTATLAFLNVESVQGGTANDTFRLATTNSVVTTTIDGGATGTDTVEGPAVASTFTVAADGQVALDVNGAPTGAMTVTGIENITGGAEGDTFTFTGTAVIAGTASGAGGNDTFNFNGSAMSAVDGGANTAAGDTLNLTGLANVDVQLTGTPDAAGFGGTVATKTFAGINTINAAVGGTEELLGLNRVTTWSLGSTTSTYTDTVTGEILTFTEFEELTGGDNNDTFRLADPAFDVTAAIDAGGGAGSDTIAGPDAVNTFAIAAPGAVDLTVDAGGSLSLTGIENALGGTAADTFTFTNNGTLAGTASGGDGNDTFNFNGSAATHVDGGANTAAGDTLNLGTLTNVTAQLTGTPDATGFGGTFAAKNFAGIDTINAAAGGTDQLRGLDRATTWDLAATSTYTDTVSGEILTFTEFDALTGGDDNDTFRLADPAFAVTAVIDAGVGAGSDTLAGPNAASTFAIDAPGEVDLTVNGNTGSLSLTGIENALGGTAADTFTFTNNGTLAGTASGGDGNDTFNFNGSAATHVDGGANTATGDTLNLGTLTNVTAQLTGTPDAAGFGGTFAAKNFAGIDTINAAAGGTDQLLGLNRVTTWDLAATSTYTDTSTTEVLTFTQFDQLTGGTANDTFRLADVDFEVTATVTAGAGVDTLQGAATQASTFVVAAPGATLTVDGEDGSLTVGGIENLVGGTGGDTFDLNVVLAGTVTGGDGADVLDIAGVAGARTVALTSRDTTLGFAGTDAAVNGGGANGFTGINEIRAAAGGADTLVGLGERAVWAIDGTDDVTYGTTPTTQTLAFSGFDNVTGGNNVDIFNFETGGTLTNVIGGPGNDEFNFNGGNVITSASGGSGLDTFRLNNTAVAITGVLSGGTGGETATAGDTVEGPAATAATFTVGATETVVTVGGPVLARVSDIEYLTGGSQDDRFVFNADLSGRASGGGGNDTFELNTAITGRIAGDAGADILDLEGLAGRNVTLTAVVANGYAGTEAALNGGAANGFVDIEEIRAAAGGTDELTGLSAAATWTLAATHTYGLTAGGVPLLTFSGFENLNGGAGVFADTFDVDAAFTGRLDGNDGADILDLSGLAGRNVTLTGVASTGYAGSEASVSNGFVDIDDIRAAAGGTDSLTGLASAATWGLDGSNTYTATPGANPSLAFSGFENLKGTGAFVDTFDVDVPFTGSLDGDDGDDVLDLTGVAGVRSVTLTAVAANGYAGTEASVSGGFANINDIQAGGGATDALTGLNAAATWSLAATKTYGLTAGGSPLLTFSGFENLSGGTGVFVDTFDVDVAFTGSLDGNDGADILDLTGLAGARNVTLTAVASTGYAGTEASVSGGFVDIDNIQAGGAATDSLTGLNAAATWSLAATKTYGLTAGGSPLLTFSGFENLSGGTGVFVDTFDVDVAFTGSLDGNDGADILDLTGLAGARNVTLTAVASTGYAGTEASVSGGFVDIDNIQAGGAATDSLTGLASAATWGLDGTNTYTATPGTNPALAFSGFENLNGGAGVFADTFDVDAAFTGRLDGNDGADILDLSGLAGRNVTLTGVASTGYAGSEASVSNGFVDIDDIRAAAGGTDSLTGLASAATWGLDGSNTYTATPGANPSLAFSGFENLKGTGAFVDTFDVDVPFTGSLDGDDGDDVLDLTGVAGVRSVTLTAVAANGYAGTEASVSGGFANINDIQAGGGATDALTGLNAAATWSLAATKTYGLTAGGSPLLTFSGFENLSGGTGVFVDTFDVDVAFTGSLDGNDGADILDLTGLAGARNVTLTAVASTGYAGTEASVSGGFVDIDNIQAGGAATDSLTGLASAATWGLDGTNTYTATPGTNPALAFSGFENLNGGAGAFVDTFDVDAAFTGRLDGNDGADVLDLTGVTGARSVTLTAVAATGYAGTEASVSNGFVNIDEIRAGGAATDALTGLNAPSTWNLAATRTYGLTAGGNPLLTFSGFENLTGGSLADIFNFSVALGGNVSGGAGADVFNFLAGAFSGTAAGGDDDDTVNLSGGDVTGAVTGDAGNDTFNLNAANIAVTAALDAGSGTGDRVVGLAAGSTFAVVGTGVTVSANGDVGGVSVNNVENAVGGAGADVLDLTGVTGTRNVLLTAAATTGYTGTDTSIAFTDIDDIRAGAATDDALTGLAAPSVWGLDGTNTYTAGTNPALAFSGFENLAGGTNADTFNVSAPFVGAIDGNGGADVLDFAGLAGDRAVALTAGAADGFAGTEAAVSGGFADINEIRGGAGTTDALTGVDAAATWTLAATKTYATGGETLTFSGFEHLAGGSAVDTFDVDAAFAGSVDGNAGADILDLTGIAASNVTLTAGAATGFAGSDSSVIGGFADIDDLRAGAGTTDALTGLNAAASWNLAAAKTYVTGGNTLMFSGFENLGGGSAVDTFDVDAAFTGTVDGNAGADILDLTGIGASNVTLTAGTATGFSGTDASVTGGFADIDDLRAGAGTTDALTGTNAAATWNLAATKTYVTGGNTLTFSGFENLGGGSAVDTFDIDVAHTGNIDGNAGADVLDIGGVAGARSVTLTSGAATGFAGTDGSVTGNFVDIDDIRAGSATTDTITGLDAAATWGVGATNTYASGGNTLAFAGFENLAGGTGIDTFNFASAFAGTATGGAGADVFGIAAAVTGTVSGGADNDVFTLTTSSTGVLNGDAGNDTFNVNAGTGAPMNGGAGDDAFILANGVVATGLLDGNAGSDFLNLSASTAPRNVDITGADAEGFDGSVPGVATFANVDDVRGSAAVGDRLALVANTAASWLLSSGTTNANTLEINGQTLRFANFNILTGGGANDAFNLSGAHTGALEIQGSGGVDVATIVAALSSTGALTFNGVETVASPQGGTVAAPGGVNVIGATGGVTLRSAGTLLIGHIDAGSPNATGNTVTLIATGNIENAASAQGGERGISGRSASVSTTGDLGTRSSLIVFTLASDGTLELRADDVNYENRNSTPLSDTSLILGTLFEAVAGSALQASTLSAVTDTSAIDWVGLDPNVALVDCLQPCVRLPADQSEEEEGLAKVREASKLLLIRTRDGWKMIPVFPVETTAALR